MQGNIEFGNNSKLVRTMKSYLNADMQVPLELLLFITILILNDINLFHLLNNKTVLASIHTSTKGNPPTQLIIISYCKRDFFKVKQEKEINNVGF